MIYVQHLLGIGHLRRAAYLAQAIAANGFEVALVSGGRPVKNLPIQGVNLHQLPPVHCVDSNFDKLLDENDCPIDEAWKQNRRKQLLTLFDQLEPDVLITETYPFGRRMMRFELLPLLTAAKKRSQSALVLCSIRDILQPKTKHGRNLEIVEIVNQYYDQLLIHGDEKVATLADTFKLADQISSKINYTGYISENNESINHSDAGTDEVIVSGGGGAASLPLLKAALKAKERSPLNHLTWRLLVGYNIDENTFESLQLSAGKGIIVERNRSDFSTLLSNCTLSISQAGYNTVMDLLQSGTRCILVPFAQGGELEQTIRARLLQQHQRAIVVEEKNLSIEKLSSALTQVMQLPLSTMDFRINGANVSAEMIDNWLA